jgi:hypothetical protein
MQESIFFLTIQTFWTVCTVLYSTVPQRYQPHGVAIRSRSGLDLAFFTQLAVQAFASTNPHTTREEPQSKGK